MAKSKKRAASVLDDAAGDAQQQLSSIADMVRWCASRFNEAGLAFGHGHDSAVDEALALVLHSLHLQPSLAPEMFPAHLTLRERKAITGLAVERIRSRKPLAYVLGSAWFAGLHFHVDERALVPRSPLAEWITKGFEPFLHPSRVHAVADVGTGCGCIAIACAHAFAGARVDAVDISTDALDLAEVNIAGHQMQDRVHLIEGDLLSGCEGPYDLIISNPPYVPRRSFEDLPPEYTYEPAMGLRAGETGLDLVHGILAQAVERLSDDGILVVEVGEAQDALVQAYPQLPFVWLTFEHGGEGVFMIDRLRLEAGLRTRS